MKVSQISIIILFAALLISCEVQSGISKKSVEKYTETPTPEAVVKPTEEPIDPADAIEVNIGEQGPPISINDQAEGKRANCSKYNRVMVNGDGMKFDIRGACSQIMINGDRNNITAEAMAEVVLNGHENNIQYLKYINAKRPLITDNGQGNLIEKGPSAGPTGSNIKK